MKVVDEIIELLSSDAPNLCDALFRSKVLAHRMGQADMLQWLEAELRGYPEDLELPDYRKATISIYGNVSNAGYRHTDHPIPTHHLEEKIRKKLETNDLRQSIVVIEKYAKDESDIAISIDPIFNSSLSEGLGGGFCVERAWGKASLGTMLQVTVEVRTRLLGFLLELSDRIPGDIPDEAIKQKSKEVGVNDLFRNAVFGDNVTILVGSGSIGSVSNSIIKNDFDSLASTLTSNGVPVDEINALRTAISDDEKSDNVKSGNIGPKVQAWMGNMFTKAGTSAWAVSVAAAGNLLGTAIAAYYGIGA